MGVTDLITPIALSNGDYVELSVDNCTLNSTLHFLGTLPAQTDMGVIISDNNVGFEPSTLSSSGLLLNGEDR